MITKLCQGKPNLGIFLKQLSIAKNKESWKLEQGKLNKDKDGDVAENAVRIIN